MHDRDALPQADEPQHVHGAEQCGEGALQVEGLAVQVVDLEAMGEVTDASAVAVRMRHHHHLTVHGHNSFNVRCLGTSTISGACDAAQEPGIAIAHLVAELDQLLGQLQDVVLDAAAVGIEEVRDQEHALQHNVTAEWAMIRR